MLQNPCHLCMKHEADQEYLVASGRFQNLQIHTCWRCRSKAPEDRFDEFCNLVMEEGGSVGMAQLVMQGPPPVKSPSMLGAGGKRGIDQFEKLPPDMREAYIEPALAAGVNVTGGRYYSELAAFPGDPEAWVDDSDQAKALLEKRGWGSPTLGVKPRVDEEPERVGQLGDDIVEDYVAGALADVPEERITPGLVQEAAEAARHQHSKRA